MPAIRRIAVEKGASKKGTEVIKERKKGTEVIKER